VSGPAEAPTFLVPIINPLFSARTLGRSLRTACREARSIREPIGKSELFNDLFFFRITCMKEPFSKRQGYGGGSRTPILDMAPQKLRIGIWNLIEDYVKEKSLPSKLPDYDYLYTKLTAHFKLKRTTTEYQSYEVESMVLRSFKWYELFDLVELLFSEVFYYDYDESDREWSRFPNKIGDARYRYTKDMNHLFSSENMGWRLRKGQLERVGCDLLDRELIEKARKLLLNPDYAGPNSQFNKALEFFSRRPKPDLENCVKDAVGALEGLARILLKDNNITLGKAVNVLVEKNIIRKPFDKTFHALYGFVSSEPGPRHGAHVLSSIDIPEAEFVLYNSAVCILFLANKFGIKPATEETAPADDRWPDGASEDDSHGTPPGDDDVPF